MEIGTHHTLEALQMIYGAKRANEGTLHRLPTGGTCPEKTERTHQYRIGCPGYLVGRVRAAIEEHRWAGHVKGLGGRMTYVDVTLLTELDVGGGRFGACELEEPE